MNPISLALIPIQDRHHSDRLQWFPWRLLDANQNHRGETEGGFDDKTWKGNWKLSSLYFLVRSRSVSADSVAHTCLHDSLPLKMYKHSNNKNMTSGAIAAMLSTILYGRRFFPYYVYNIIGGLDEEGRGAVYSFDPVGSYQRDTYKAGGSASAMLQPLLDNQIGFKNMENVEQVPLSLEKAVQLVKDVFISAAERDVYTGDALKICIITKEGVREEIVPLRKD
uniref:Proteasome subunit beta type-1 n=1 Tax=Cyprinus carpio carpio TaxID=630221 RepID=A0A9J7Y5P8_CYPCA